MPYLRIKEKIVCVPVDQVDKLLDEQGERVMSNGVRMVGFAIPTDAELKAWAKNHPGDQAGINACLKVSKPKTPKEPDAPKDPKASKAPKSSRPAKE